MVSQVLNGFTGFKWFHRFYLLSKRTRTRIMSLCAEKKIYSLKVLNSLKSF